MELDPLAQVGDQLRPVELLAVGLRVLLGLRRERVQQHLGRPDPRPVRRRALRVGLAADLLQVARVQLEDLAAVDDPHLLRRARRGVAQRAQQHLPHPQRTLDGGQRRRVLPRRLQAVEDLAERAQLDVRLTHRGEDARDVAGEHPGRPDHQHAGPAELTPVAVEQVGGAVQRDGGLAGARPAGDLGDPAPRRPDHLVLLLLDGRDDVAHLLAARTPQRGHQRAFADDLHVLGHGLGHQHVVVDVQHVLAGAADHAPPHDVHRLFGGGLVERRRGRGAPVRDEVVELRVADAEPADVDAFGVLEVVEPAEDEALVLGVERLQRLVGVVDHHVALEQHRRLLEDRLALRALADLVALRAHRLGLGAQFVQTGVHAIDVGLFDGDLGPSDPRFRHAWLLDSFWIASEGEERLYALGAAGSPMSRPSVLRVLPRTIGG